jgi:phospholipase/lecithinase/hemolysin
VAAIYGLTFPQCPSDTAVTDPVSHIYATNEAKVADLSTQIDTHLGTGDSFISGDLVTVLIGMNDIVAQFKTYDGSNEADLLANVEAAGAELADQVNRIATLGGKVIVSTIPDMGRTPFAGDRTDATNPNPGVLSRLSTRFNDALLSNLINDGHKIGLVQLDQYLIAVDNATQAGVTTSFANTTQAACLPSIPLVNCTTNTLQPDAVNSTWLWADDRHLGPSGQTSLGSLAVTRAQNNPF